MSTILKYDEIAAAMMKACGGNDETMGITRWLSTGYLPLDQAVSGLKEGGGLPSGRLIEIAGPPSAGKTALATQVMIAAQRAGGIAVFHDHERSFEKKQAQRLGLDMEFGKFMIKTPRTFEDSVSSFITTAQAIRGTKQGKTVPLVWVFDSIASMIPASQLAKDPTMMNMNDQSALSRVLSLNLKVLTLIAEELDVCMVFLNQTRTKLGVMFGDPITTAGGDAAKFYFSVRIMLSSKKLTKGTGEDKEVIGSEVKAVTIKNKVNRPFLATKWQFMFREDGSGFFDIAGSLIDVLVQKGILSKVGSTGRIEWIDGSKPHRSELIEKIYAAPNGISALEKLMIKAGVTVEHDAEAEKSARDSALADEAGDEAA